MQARYFNTRSKKLPRNDLTRIICNFDRSARNDECFLRLCFIKIFGPNIGSEPFFEKAYTRRLTLHLFLMINKNTTN